MTREHKLALVVGFGLILIVGILISDHFSTSTRSATADLSATTDGLAQNTNKLRQRPDDLIEVYPAAVSLTQAQSPVAASNPAAQPTATRPSQAPRTRLASNISAPENPRQLRTPNLQQLATQSPTGNAGATSTSFDFYQVRQGDSLTSICRTHYGATDMVDDVARYNGLNNPNALRLNHRLRLPKLSTISGQPAIATTTSSRPRTNAAYSSYTVVSGDTFSEVTQRLMGSVSHMDTLLKLNATTITNPDQLRVGMVLRYPAGR